jgi:hypothetical protein
MNKEISFKLYQVFNGIEKDKCLISVHKTKKDCQDEIAHYHKTGLGGWFIITKVTEEKIQ